MTDAATWESRATARDPPAVRDARLRDHAGPARRGSDVRDRETGESVIKDALGGKATRKARSPGPLRRHARRPEDGPARSTSRTRGRGPGRRSSRWNFFGGNHAVRTPDPRVPLARPWTHTTDPTKRTSSPPISDRGKEASRTGRWNTSSTAVLCRGHGVLRATSTPTSTTAGQERRPPRSSTRPARPARPTPGVRSACLGLGAELRRAMDLALETDGDIDAKGGSPVMGHSRLRQDGRSGPGAAGTAGSRRRSSRTQRLGRGRRTEALSRRWYGETVARINTSFPHWFK